MVAQLRGIGMPRRLVNCAFALVSAIVLAPAGDASAQSRRAQDRGYGHGYVVAESQWGHGMVRGAVRPGPRGWQVQLPGGSWIDCVRNRCSETLRLETVDVFERMQQKDGGPGYFRWERRF
jgi:hypothetical protein